LKSSQERVAQGCSYSLPQERDKVAASAMSLRQECSKLPVPASRGAGTQPW
jgi:hypothetical protein